MIWKELKKDNYKNYTYVIYGKYTEDFPIEIGETVYKESIETKVKVLNPLGEVIKVVDWIEYEGGGYFITYNKPYKCLIQFNPIYKKTFGFKKLVGTLHIEEKYDLVIREWESFVKQLVDNSIKEHEKEKYEQQVTDGLPESVFKLYTDH